MTHTDQIHPRVQFTDSEGLLTPFAFKFLVNIYEKLGGPKDLIQELEVGELYEPGLETGLLIDTIDELESHEFQHQEQEEGDYPLPQIPVQMFTAVTKSTDYTALPYDFVAVTKDATIKLPVNPDDNDQVIVLNVNGSEVIVDGNGKTINNDTSTRSLRQNTGIVYQYFIDLDQWYMPMIEINDINHEIVVRQELKEVREQLQVIAMILREAFDIDIVTGDIEDDQ